MIPLQADVTGGGPLALVVTFFVTAVFYAVTLHLAATFFIGDVPSQRAAYVSFAPAIVSLLLRRWGQTTGVVSPEVGILVTIVATLIADAFAISFVYRLKWSSTAVLSVLHFAFAVILGLALNNLFGLTG